MKNLKDGKGNGILMFHISLIDHIVFNQNSSFQSFHRAKSLLKAERKRKSGKEDLHLSDDTVRKLSALLWYNPTSNANKTNVGVKIDGVGDAIGDQKKTDTVKEQDHGSENNNNNNNLKHCVVEMETSNDAYENKTVTVGFSESNPNEVRVEVLHHGKFCLAVNVLHIG